MSRRSFRRCLTAGASIATTSALGLLGTSVHAREGIAVPPPNAASTSGPSDSQASEAVGDELTLDRVIRATLRSHPLLEAAQKERAIADADVRSAEGSFDPTVRARLTTIPLGPYPSDRIDTLAELPTSLWGTRFFAGYRASRGSFANYDYKLVTGDLGEARVGAQVPLWRDGPIDRRRASLARAELGTDVASLSVTQQQLELARACSHRFWDWVASGRRMAVARDILTMAAARDAGLGVRVDQGDIPAFERTENERVIHQRTAQLASAERNVQNTSIELSLCLRDSQGRPQQPDASRMPKAFPDSPWYEAHPEAKTSEERAIAQRPELRRFQKLSEQTRIDRDFASNQRKLGVDLFVAGAKDMGHAVETKILKPELEVALQLDIPIATRIQEGRVRAAEATLARIELQTQFAKERIVADVHDASSAVAKASERIASTRREVVASRQLVEMERQRFDLGEGTLLLVNLREQSLAEAQLREIDALADYFKAVASHHVAQGSFPKETM